MGSEPLTVGIAIPSIPIRKGQLQTAFSSALMQTRPPAAISVALDVHHDGAAATRNRAWRALDTDYVAFLDDDDELCPHHVERLVECALANDADMVYPWFHIEGGGDPFPHHYGLPWDPERPRQTTITCLWRRDALEKIGGFPPHSREVMDDGHWLGEDYLAVLALNEAGGRIVHLPERTWIWHMHPGSTMGLPDRW